MFHHRRVGDYFINTAGAIRTLSPLVTHMHLLMICLLSVVAGVGTTFWNNPQIIAKATEIFDRDWNSAYTIPLPATSSPTPTPAPSA